MNYVMLWSSAMLGYVAHVVLVIGIVWWWIERYLSAAGRG